MNDLVFIPIYIAVCIALIVGEFAICKLTKKHKGIILPTIAIIATLFFVLMHWRSSVIVSGGENSAFAQTKFLDNPKTIRDISLLGGIPTLLLFVIDFVFVQIKKKVNRELKKIDIDMLEQSL